MTRVGPLSIHLRLMCGDSFALGPGKVDLLEAIAATGSISAAGRAMEMSYRRAWMLVDEMNRCFQTPLVETLLGGGRERGARLTSTGHLAVQCYRSMEQESARVADSDAYQSLEALLRDSPRPRPETPPDN